MHAKLTNTQIAVLKAAAGRAEGNIEPLPVDARTKLPSFTPRFAASGRADHLRLPVRSPFNYPTVAIQSTWADSIRWARLCSAGWWAYFWRARKRRDSNPSDVSTMLTHPHALGNIIMSTTHEQRAPAWKSW